MTHAELKSLHEKRSKIAAEMKSLVDASFDQASKTWKDAEKGAQWDALDAEFEAVNSAHDSAKAEIDKQDEAARRIEARMAGIASLESAPIDRLIGRDGAALSGTSGTDEVVDKNEDIVFALQSWLGNGIVNLTERHRSAAQRLRINPSAREIRLPMARNFASVRNALSTLDGTKGGYTFGDTFVGQLEKAMLAFGGVLNVAEIIRTESGEPMWWPTADDTSNTGEILGEGVAATGADGTGPDPSFSRTSWGAYTFSSKAIRVPFALLQDSAFDLAAIWADMLGERLGRRQSTAFTTGNGASGPYGIVTRATLGVTTASATAITFDELIDLEHSIDPSRRGLPGIGYMFHDNILKALKKLKDSNGLYLWKQGTESGAPSTLNGYPYQISQEMSSTVTASDKTALFGQLSAYKVRQVNGMRLKRFDELYGESDEVAFLALIRADGNLLDAGDHPVKYLLQHA